MRPYRCTAGRRPVRMTSILSPSVTLIFPHGAIWSRKKAENSNSKSILKSKLVSESCMLIGTNLEKRIQIPLMNAGTGPFHVLAPLRVFDTVLSSISFLVSPRSRMTISWATAISEGTHLGYHQPSESLRTLLRPILMRTIHPTDKKTKTRD